MSERQFTIQMLKTYVNICTLCEQQCQASPYSECCNDRTERQEREIPVKAYA